MWESLPVFGVWWWEDPIAGSQLCPIVTYSALYFLGQHKVAQDAPPPLPSAPRTATGQVCVRWAEGKAAHVLASEGCWHPGVLEGYVERRWKAQPCRQGGAQAHRSGATLVPPGLSRSHCLQEPEPFLLVHCHEATLPSIEPCKSHTFASQFLGCWRVTTMLLDPLLSSHVFCNCRTKALCRLLAMRRSPTGPLTVSKLAMGEGLPE